MSAKSEFDEVESGKVYFNIGSTFEGISVSSLKELKHMFDVTPMVWSESQWIEPSKKSKKKYFGKPFEKEIYMGISLTRDFLEIPKIMTMNHLSFWSGSQKCHTGINHDAGIEIGINQE